MDFAKLFRLENGEQVLVTLDYDDEDDQYKVNSSSEIEGVRIKMGFCFDEEEDAVKCFNSYAQEQAEGFYKNTVQKMLTSEPNVQVSDTTKAESGNNS